VARRFREYEGAQDPQAGQVLQILPLSYATKASESSARHLPTFEFMYTTHCIFFTKHLFTSISSANVWEHTDQDALIQLDEDGLQVRSISLHC
jgi:hypothetical protein